MRNYYVHGRYNISTYVHGALHALSPANSQKAQGVIPFFEKLRSNLGDKEI